MGEVRRKETISAMAELGVYKSNIIFLGYPDFGTMAILTKYWDAAKPFKGFFTRSTKVPYPECLSPGAPYVGESIIKDMKAVLSDFKPTKIFVSHPADTSGDHRSLYLFLRIALWDLESAISRPRIFSYIVHAAGWPKPRGYNPELALEPPRAFPEVSWDTLSLTPDEVASKYKCISFYKSEIGYDPP
jgi:LmbE family N-acetylglucosaminyl deacetylase